jgi:hypothetical protein
VALLATKLLLAPSFVVGASLTARRFGARVGGLIAGLPVVAGPILLAYALAHGSAFAAGLGLGLLLTPRVTEEDTGASAPPRWDLPMRAACALALVLTLTAVAGWLGPRLSGLLAPFPIIATVLATFTHAQRGSEEVQHLLRWLLGGYGAFALFCFTLAVALRPLGTATAFALASTVAVLTQGAILALMRRLPAVAAAPVPDPAAAVSPSSGR